MGCSECLFCDNLQNQSYCIENKVYSKDEYFKQKVLLLREKEIFDKRYAAVPNR
jgi:tmRNA-binding protein